MALQHYDVFAPVYDLVTGLPHRSHRDAVAHQLRLAAAQTVVDMPCGTGASFGRLLAGIGPSGRLIGCDYSPGMLRRAQARVERKRWRNVTLVEADARRVDRCRLGVDHVDAVLCMLGLTCIPEWETVIDRALDLLDPGGRFVAMDLYLAGTRWSGLANAFFSTVANADSTRRWWEPIEARVADYAARDFWWPGGFARVVAGDKRAD